MPITCKNCHQEFEGAYCSYCGQAAATPGMNFRYLRDNFVGELLPFDKGILFTLRELFTRPGYTIREYIDGKRIRHCSVIALVSYFYFMKGK